MKTTVDIPDDLHRQVRIRAAEEGTTLRELLLRSLTESLARTSGSRGGPPRRERFEIDERGWPVLKRKRGAATVVTDEFVNRLRQREGV